MAGARGAPGADAVITLYIVCLVMGGVLVAASALGAGGHDGVHQELEHEAPSHGGEAEPEVHGHDASHEVELTELSQVPSVSSTESPAGGAWLPFLSLRFWTFFSAFFGLTGLTLTLLSLSSPPVALAAAVGVGIVSGVGVTSLFRAVKGAQVDSSVEVEDLQGAVGRVLVPIDVGSEGLVRVKVKGAVKDLRAVTDDGAPITRGASALVLLVRDGVARVTATGDRAVETRDETTPAATKRPGGIAQRS
jgi:membrane protein implicated in regulation of membrane protease activity